MQAAINNWFLGVLSRIKKIKKKHVYNFIWTVIRFILIFGICFVIIYPMLTKISVSFKSELDMYDPTVKYIPKNPNLFNYEKMISVLNYFPTLATSVLLCAGVGLLTTLSTTMVGYGFAKFKFKGRELIFALVILTLIIPPQSMMTSHYLNLRNLLGFTGIDLTTNMGSMFLLAATSMGIKSGLFIFMMRQYFRGMPNELSESAAIDGAGQFRIFTSIMLPPALTMMVTIFLFIFVWQWSDTYFTSMLTSSLPTLAKKLSLFYSGDAIRYEEGIVPGNNQVKTSMLMITGEFLVILPLIVVYIFGQKFIVEGVERSGIVG